jgi:hypothetical protein
MITEPLCTQRNLSIEDERVPAPNVLFLAGDQAEIVGDLLYFGRQLHCGARPFGAWRL